MSAEELYTKIMADAGLQKALEDATDSGKVAEFLAAQGCSASVDEFTACLASHDWLRTAMEVFFTIAVFLSIVVS